MLAALSSPLSAIVGPCFAAATRRPSDTRAFFPNPRLLESWEAGGRCRAFAAAKLPEPLEGQPIGGDRVDRDSRSQRGYTAPITAALLAIHRGTELESERRR